MNLNCRIVRDILTRLYLNHIPAINNTIRTMELDIFVVYVYLNFNLKVGTLAT